MRRKESCLARFEPVRICSAVFIFVSVSVVVRWFVSFFCCRSTSSNIPFFKINRRSICGRISEERAATYTYSCVVESAND